MGYHSVRVAQMLGKYGAIGAARRLMASPDLREPELTRFFKLGRLDPTVEAVVLRNPQHFHEDEVVAALRRLGPYGFSIERYACKKPPGR